MIFKRYLPLIAILCAALSVLSALASPSEPPKVAAAYPYWSPEQVAITPGASVEFSNTQGIPHGITWNGGPSTPECTAVPISRFESSWSGTCKFNQEGEYPYYCSYHGPVMHGVVFVNADGTVSTSTQTTTTTPTTNTTTTTQTTPPPTETTTSTTTGSTQTTTPASATQSSSPGGPVPTSATDTSLSSQPHDSLANGFLLLAHLQRGGHVRGQLKIAVGRSGFQIALTARSEQLAKHSGGSIVIGSFRKSAISPGKLTFSISLSSSGKRALARKHRLAVVAHLTLSEPGGLKLTRSVNLSVRA